MRLLWAVASMAALFAGCAEVPADCDDADCEPPSTSGPTSDPGGGHGFAPQQGTAHGSNAGIHVDVAWRACDAGFCANATATNRGTDTVQVSSICESPWTDRMARDGQAVPHREPLFTCLAYGRAPFAPGDSMQANLTWDGQLHGDDPGPAPEGAYTWTIAFWWDDAHGGARQEASAQVHLVVGET